MHLERVVLLTIVSMSQLSDVWFIVQVWVWIGFNVSWQDCKTSLQWLAA